MVRTELSQVDLIRPINPPGKNKDPVVRFVRANGTRIFRLTDGDVRVEVGAQRRWIGRHCVAAYDIYQQEGTGAEGDENALAPVNPQLQCPECGEHFRVKTALGAHRRYKHGVRATKPKPD